MDEYRDNTEESIQFSLENGEWACEQATKLIRKYKACKTAHAQARMRPQLDYMLKKLSFEGREIAKLMGYDESQNEFSVS